jgi:hypothetical protein
MATFLVELYLSASRTPAPDEVLRALRAASAEPAGDVECRRAFVVPEDETCFLVFAAPSAGDVRRTLELAGVEYDRIAEAEELGEVTPIRAGGQRAPCASGGQLVVDLREVDSIPDDGAGRGVGRADVHPAPHR